MARNQPKSDKRRKKVNQMTAEEAQRKLNSEEENNGGLSIYADHLRAQIALKSRK